MNQKKTNNSTTTFLVSDYYTIDHNKVYEDLLYSCQNGDIQKIKFLLTEPILNSSHLINVSDDYYHTPLTYAAHHNQIETVKYLLSSEDLKEHADLSFDEYKVLQVCSTASHFNDELLKFLFSYGEIQNIKKEMPVEQLLYNSFCNGNKNCLDFLLSDDDIKELIPNIISYSLDEIFYFSLEGTQYLIENFKSSISTNKLMASLFSLYRRDKLENIDFIVASYDLRYRTTVKKAILSEFKDDQTAINHFDNILGKNELRHQIEEQTKKDHLRSSKKHKI